MIHQWQKWKADVYGYTVWHYIFAGSNFCDFCGFLHDPPKKAPAKKISRKKKFPRKKFPAKIFSAKIYSTVEITYKHRLLSVM